jgi:hypothetical protein
MLARVVPGAGRLATGFRRISVVTPRPPTNYRLQGIAPALAELARAHMEPDLALMVLDSLGLTIGELKAAGADPYDLVDTS